MWQFLTGFEGIIFLLGMKCDICVTKLSTEDKTAAFSVSSLYLCNRPGQKSREFQRDKNV